MNTMARPKLNTDFQEPPELLDGAKWFCVTTNPNCQKRAELGLYAAGFCTFVPKVRKWVSHARVKTAVERPLLGRYMFVAVDHPNQSFGSVRAINGIEGFVSNPDPISIPSIYVTQFRERYMSGEWDFVEKEPFPIGARVKVIEGEFNDMLATVIGRKGHKVDFKITDSTKIARMHECSLRAA
jgi:transcription antitermination factor NusG